MDQASKFASAFQSDQPDPIVEIALEDGGNFTVQRALLCGASEYFRSALLGGFAEAKDKKLKLPGCDTAVFELLLYWICKRTIPENDGDHPCNGEDPTCIELQATLVRLWYAADMYLMPELQNATMHYLLDIIISCYMGHLAIETAFSTGSPACLMRNMLVEEYVWEFYKHPERFGLENEMDELAKIPGFFAAFALIVRTDRRDSHNRSIRDTAAKNRRLRTKYMVPEQDRSQ